MLQINTTELLDETKRNSYVETLLDKCGITRNVESLVNYIEDDIAGIYTQHNEEDEDNEIASYGGGVIYEGYELVDDGQVTSLLKRLLTAQETAFLLDASNGDLRLSVERTDYDFEQVWSMVFDLKDSDGICVVFPLEVVLKVSLFRSEIQSIESKFAVESLVNDFLEQMRLETYKS